MAIKRRKKRKPYTLNQLQMILSTAVRELERIYLDDRTDSEKRVRAINSLASLANSYSRLTEVADLEERIKKLEENAQN